MEGMTSAYAMEQFWESLATPLSIEHFLSVRNWTLIIEEMHKRYGPAAHVEQSRFQDQCGWWWGDFSEDLMASGAYQVMSFRFQWEMTVKCYCRWTSCQEQVNCGQGQSASLDPEPEATDVASFDVTGKEEKSMRTILHNAEMWAILWPLR